MSAPKPENTERPEREKRVARVVRAAEEKVTDTARAAVAFERADLAETEHEWREQLHNDGAELRADVARDKQKVVQAADDLRHPERIAAAVEARVEHGAEEAASAARAIEHPGVIVADAERAAAAKKAAFDRTAATIAAEFTSPADARKLPRVLKVFGVLLALVSLATLPGIGTAIYRSVTSVEAHGLGA